MELILFYLITLVIGLFVGKLFNKYSDKEGHLYPAPLFLLFVPLVNIVVICICCVSFMFQRIKFTKLSNWFYNE